MPAEAPAPLECDLVMKGGVTSGVVYIPLVLRLKDRYRIRRIGGTSAGAIVAAYTAAAEFARESGGYARLKGLQAQLGQPGFIRGLFQLSRAWTSTATCRSTPR